MNPSAARRKLKKPKQMPQVAREEIEEAIEKSQEIQALPIPFFDRTNVLLLITIISLMIIFIAIKYFSKYLMFV